MKRQGSRLARVPNCGLAASGAMLLLTALAEAQGPPLGLSADRNVRAQQISAQALNLAEKGEWKQAEKMLQDEIRGCEGSDALRPCRLLLNYSLGYLAQMRGGPGALGAGEYYRRVLNEQPNNGPALNNLALVEETLHHDAAAEELWNRAINSDASRAGQYAILLGDHYLRGKKYREALQSYELGAVKAPEAEAPRRRIVEVYRQQTEAPLEELAQQAGEWEKLFPGAARSAYELILARWYNQPGRSDSAQQILVRWTSLLARQEWLTPQSLTALPASWNPPSVGELRAYLEDPLRGGTRWSWWLNSTGRRGVVLEVSTAVGKQRLREPQGPQYAAQCWETALRASPSPDAYVEFDSASGLGPGLAALLRLNQDLASLFYQYPALDPDGAKLAKVVEKLFEAKWWYIQKGNWEATQSYHTALALIYVDRGIWKPRPGTFEAAGALFQLRAALDDADKRLRDPREKFFQPLPELKAKLAEGYRREGPTAEAARWYLAAALAYLDTDALDAASEMLAQHRKLVPEMKPAVQQVERIIAARRSIARSSSSAITPQAAPWLFQASGAVDDDFLKRQRFKIFADLAQASTGGGKPPDLSAALEAYHLGVEQQTALAGAGDLVRWQRVEMHLLTSTNAAPAPSRLRYQLAGASGAPPQAALRLALPGESRQAMVTVNPHTTLAVQIVRAVGPEKMEKVRPHLGIRNGTVIITPRQPAPDVVPLLEKIKRIPNLPQNLRPPGR